MDGRRDGETLPNKDRPREPGVVLEQDDQPSNGDAEPTGEQTDGRRARGDDRRRAIAEAVIAVIADWGVGGVTHRRVAKAAGVPLGSTTYYFETLTDLLVAGMTLAAERNVIAMRQFGAELDAGVPLVQALAERAADLASRHRALYLSECELYLAAAREPTLRDAARSLTATMAAAIRPHVISDAAALSVVHVFDGVLFEALLQDAPPTDDDLLPLFAPLVSAVQPSSGGRKG